MTLLARLLSLTPKGPLCFISFGSMLANLLLAVTPLIYGFIIDQAIPTRELTRLYQAVATFVAILFTATLLDLIITTVSIQFRSLLVKTLRLKLFETLLELPIHTASFKRSGQAIATIFQDVETVQRLGGEFLTFFLRDLSLLAIFFALLLLIAPPLAFCSLGFLPIFILVYLIFQKRLLWKGKRLQQAKANLQGALQEEWNGRYLLKTFKDAEPGETKQKIVATEKTQAQVLFLEALTRTSTALFPILGVSLVWGYGGTQVIQGSISLGALITASYLLTLLYPPTSRLFSLLVGWPSLKVALQHIFSLLDLMPKRNEQKGDPLTIQQATVRLEEVSFAFQPDRPIFQKVNCLIESGKCIGIVGENGIGKTTLFLLLLRFYQPTTGAIYLGDEPLAHYDPTHLRSQVGYVPQEPFLFLQSIRDNILMGRIFSPQQFETVGEMVGLNIWIDTLPQGYDTLISEQGKNLSSGLKQRIALARALVGKPKLLLLDEPTSAQDLSGKQLVEQLLIQLRGKVTMLIATHDLSLLDHCDHILEIKKGAITWVNESVPQYS